LKNYLTAGIGFSRLLRLARKNSLSAHPRYLLRFLFLVQSALWSDLFSWLEQKRYGKKIASTPVPDDPIFIIGHWRTGTTLLHQLLNLDPNLAAPTLFQVAEPDCFICSYSYYLPLFSTLVADNRPMDNVKIGMNEPQEDEYAIYRITDFSPIERLVFPRDPNYFILDYNSFLPTDEKKKKEWEDQLCSYFRKLHYYHGKTIVSKNPFNSFRIRELIALFPKARFIHIVRHPYEVVPSAIHMWKIVLEQNRLNSKGAHPGIEEVAKGLDKLLTRIGKDKNIIPEENFYEMRFEELEADPVGQCRKIYSRFHMPFDEILSRNIQSFTGNLKDYRKNEFRLEEEEKNVIRKLLDQHMQNFNYQ
jgi:hypothetical protein